MGMAKSNSSFQNLGGGVYRVGGLSRSAVTGRYVTTSTAVRHPSTTVAERKTGRPVTPPK